MLHAGKMAFRDRKKKKGEFRSLWTLKINAAAREVGTTYSKLIGLLKNADIQIDRKILATLGEKHPVVFKKVVEAASK